MKHEHEDHCTATTHDTLLLIKCLVVSGAQMAIECNKRNVLCIIIDMESCSWLTVAASVTCAAQQHMVQITTPYISLGLSKRPCEPDEAQKIETGVREC